jgi:hypothetical protein
MSWSVSTKQYIPVRIGEVWGGGFFAGYISHTANGNPTHALIVAPRATGATGTGYTLTSNKSWSTSNIPSGSSLASNSSFDGRLNTDQIISAGIQNYPAAEFCVNLTIGGYTDWYLPSLLELEIAYFNLKPGTSTSVTLPSNPYAVPRLSASSFRVLQTQVSAFTTTEDFVQDVIPNAHWSSTGGGGQNNYPRHFNFGNGQTTNNFAFTATGPQKVRAFRRVSLSGYTTI